jgi:hypothetical protein
MNVLRLPVMSPQEFREWVKKSNACNVNHVERVLCGEAIDKQIKDWKLFGLKAFEDFKEKPSIEKAVRLRNMGFKVNIPKK